MHTVITRSSAAGSGGCIQVETLGWQASVAGLLFQELFLSHRLPLGRRGRKGGRREDDHRSTVFLRGRRNRVFFLVLKVSLKFS